MVAFAHDSNRIEISPQLKSRFDEMLPKIRRFTEETLEEIEPKQRDAVINLVVIHAFAIFTMLAKIGLEDVAYPRMLAWLALKQVQNSLA